MGIIIITAILILLLINYSNGGWVYDLFSGSNNHQGYDQLPDAGLEEKLKFKHDAEYVINQMPDKHWDVLSRKRKQLLIPDDYGYIDRSKWINELESYVNNNLVHKIFKSWSDVDLAILKMNLDIMDCLISCMDPIVEDHSYEKLEAHSRPSDPYEYEHYCASLFANSGWTARVTQGSGDQGADLVLTKEHREIVVQCKLYNSPVGNKAVQEVVAAQKYYGAYKGIVVTNASYTPSAKKLAAANDVILLHDTEVVTLNKLL
ncbi:MAG: restriction endonuclease [Akkermansiaceae bacterium]|nr:restriction endonuclease [Akkermansiaceae bacterium]